MKIFAIADFASDWYPKNAITSFRKYSSVEFVENPFEADLIWIFSYYQPLDSIAEKPWHSLVSDAGLRRRKGLDSVPIITSFHHLYPDKINLFKARIKEINDLSDSIQFFSKINIEQCSKLFSKPIFLLPYWIDQDIFKPFTDYEKVSLRREHGLPDDMIVIGSFQRDTEQDMKTPKLEKGPDIFCDIIESLDPSRHMVLLAGVRRDYIENRLSDAGYRVHNVGKVPHAEIARLYGALDYYLVTSRYEGGPQAILESMATKTPIYSTPVGIADLLDAAVVCEKARDFVDKINAPYPPVIENHFETAFRFEVSSVVKKYEDIFAALIEAKKNAVGSIVDKAPSIQWVTD